MGHPFHGHSNHKTCLSFVGRRQSPPEAANKLMISVIELQERILGTVTNGWALRKGISNLSRTFQDEGEIFCHMMFGFDVEICHQWDWQSLELTERATVSTG